MSKPYRYCPVKSVTLRPDAAATGAVPVPEPGDGGSTKSAETMTVAQLKDALVEAGVDVPAKAKKAELAELLADAQAASA